MLKNIKVGDRVQLLDQPWQGVVEEICGARASVLLDDGFSEWVAITKIIIQDTINYSDIEILDLEKNQTKHIEIRPLRIEEIDLHIENLFVHWRSIPVEQILDRQMQAFKEEFRVCKKKKIDQLIVIHGKGSGVLKRNLHDLLKTLPHISFEEMNTGKFKQAAIKINFHYTS